LAALEAALDAAEQRQRIIDRALAEATQAGELAVPA
jgi:hypothetical protein